MSPVTQSRHLDEFTLLRHCASDLGPRERGDADRHLEGCPRCVRSLRRSGELDIELRKLAAGGGMDEPAEGDVFARRPRRWEPPLRLPAHRAEAAAASALAASERGVVKVDALLTAARSREGLRSFLFALPFSDPANRFGLLYALQTAGHLIAENLVDALVLAEEALRRLRREPAGLDDVERVVPLPLVIGHAHLLAGQSGNWTGDYERAGEHFAEAYRLFGSSTGDPFNLAQVEYLESQRRSFVGRAADGGLSLARRARRSFEALNLEDYAARAQAAEGNALFFLGAPKEALEPFRVALATFERREMWSNYVGVLNSIGECFLRIGEPEEARRQYAKALRRVSREKQPIWVAFIRHGLANALFAAGRYREAAAALGRAARINRELGLLGNALAADLFEIESWARAGDRARAAHRLEIWLQEVVRHETLDPSLARAVHRALAGEDPDLSTLARLRREIEGMLRERFKEKQVS